MEQLLEEMQKNRSNGLKVPKSNDQLIIAIMILRYRNYAHYTPCRDCLPIFGISIVRVLSF